jgi:hypothetical protein
LFGSSLASLGLSALLFVLLETLDDSKLLPQPPPSRGRDFTNAAATGRQFAKKLPIVRGGDFEGFRATVASLP